MADETQENEVKDLTAQEAIVLNHINMLYDKLTKIWDSINHIILAETILTCVLIILSTGFVSVEEVDVYGIKIKLSITVILLIGVTLVTILHFGFMFQFESADKFQNNIANLYDSLKYTEFDIRNIDSPQAFVSVIANIDLEKEHSKIWTTLFRIMSAAITGIFLICMPIFAQIFVGWRIVSIFGWLWWIIALFILLIAFTLTCVLIHLSDQS